MDGHAAACSVQECLCSLLLCALHCIAWICCVGRQTSGSVQASPSIILATSWEGRSALAAALLLDSTSALLLCTLPAGWDAHPSLPHHLEGGDALAAALLLEGTSALLLCTLPACCDTYPCHIVRGGRRTPCCSFV
eukprot:scaffold78876_cov17-Tisochrysis_lutea.AAC.3